MGVSTDAYLFYGFSIYDPEEGIGKAPSWESEGSESWSAWEYEVEKDVKKKLCALQIDIYSHRHCDCPVYFICLKEAFFQAYRGYPKEINIEDIIVQDNAKKRLKEACKLLDIEYKNPTWQLASYWDG